MANIGFAYCAAHLLAVLITPILVVAIRMTVEGLGAFVALPEILFLYTPHVVTTTAAH